MKVTAFVTFLYATIAASFPTYTHLDVHPLDLSSPPGDAILKTVYQFPNETWVENIAVRGDGKLLVTIITSSKVYLVNPISKTSKLIYHFPNATSATGISEVESGLFAVVVGDWDPATFQATPGSWSIWTIDFRNGDSAIVKKVTNIPQAYFLNGMTTLPTQKDTLLIGDSDKGLIYSLNTQTGYYSVVIDSPALKPNASAIATLGVNGIHVRQDNGQQYLYFTNSFKAPFYGRIPLNSNGTASGNSQTILERPNYPLNLGGYADDFTFDRHGNTWITSDPSNTLAKYNVADRKLTVIAGGNDEAVLAGDTAAAFGRTKQDQDVLYITTNGGMAYPPPGGIVGGKIIALDTNGL